MNEQNQSLTLDGMSAKHMILILLSTLMVAVSIYLTKHYYDVHFSTEIVSGGLCDINAFLNCDTATHSTFASILNVPTSVFGLMFGIFLLIGSIFPSRSMEQTNSFFSKINLAGCLFLLVYSVAVLKSLCPGCTIYYLLSAGVFYLFYKNGVKENGPEIKSMALLGVLFIAVASAFSINISTKKERMSANNKALIDSTLSQFNQLPNYGAPEFNSPHRIHSSTEDFSKAPIRISVFSDFQCPYCGKLGPVLHHLAEKYDGFINIQYFFYPMDSNCHPEVKGSFHPHACQASYLAHCSGDKFVEVHDEIFDNQSSLSSEWLSDYGKKLGVLDCMKDPKTKEEVIKMITSASKTFKVQSTPSLVINGRRIDGVLPTPMFEAIADELIKRAK